MKVSVIDQFKKFCGGSVTWAKVVRFSREHPELKLTKENKLELFKQKFAL